MENSKAEYPSIADNKFNTLVNTSSQNTQFQRPIPDHYLKARYKAALEPIYPDPVASKPWFEVCGNLIKQSKEEEVCDQNI